MNYPSVRYSYRYDEAGLFYDQLAHLIPQDDIEFYKAVCERSSRRVLELACGTGRVLIPLAKSGHHVVGIDQSEKMIEQLKRKALNLDDLTKARLRVLCRDMVSFDLTDRFDAALIPFRSFEHLVDVADQVKCLSTINKHMVRGGVLALDVYNPDISKLGKPYIKKRMEDIPLEAIGDGRYIRRRTAITKCNIIEQYEDIELTIEVHDRTGGIRTIVDEFRLRHFFRFELEHLLTRCGFEVTKVTGGFHDECLHEESSIMVFTSIKVRESE